MSNIIPNPMLKFESALAEDIRLGDTVVTELGVHIGPIMRIEIDWAKNWASVLARNGDGYMCNADERVTVMRKSLKD